MLVSDKIDHTKLDVGIHVFQEHSFGDVKMWEYDLRFIIPLTQKNIRPFIEQPEMHTIEHLLAYCLRTDGNEQNVISLYPYACGTGFGCLSLLEPEKFRDHLLKTISRILIETYEFMVFKTDDTLQENFIPFCKVEECGNIFVNDLHKACVLLHNFKKDVEHQISTNDNTFLNPNRL